jgi:hypothetical protein
MLERWFPPHTTWYNLHTTGNLLTSMPLWFFLYVVSRLVHFFGGPTPRYHKISYSSIFNPAHLQSTIQYFKEVSPAVGWLNLLYQWKLIRRTSFCIDCRETSTDVTQLTRQCVLSTTLGQIQCELCNFLYVHDVVLQSRFLALRDEACHWA